jgi:hypothetical protein
VKVTHDPIDRAVSVQLAPAVIEASEELASGLIVDYDAADHIVGVEVLDAPPPPADVLRPTPAARSVFWYLRDLLRARVADPPERAQVTATLEAALGHE